MPTLRETINAVKTLSALSNEIQDQLENLDYDLSYLVEGKDDDEILTIERQIDRLTLDSASLDAAIIVLQQHPFEWE